MYSIWTLDNLYSGISETHNLENKENKSFKHKISQNV